MSRGSLLYPSSHLLHNVTVSYLAISKICESEDCHASPYLRNYLVHCSFYQLDGEDFTLLDEVCENEHDDRKVVNMII